MLDDHSRSLLPRDTRPGQRESLARRTLYGPVAIYQREARDDNGGTYVLPIPC